MSSFTDLGVPARLTSVLAGLGISTPTPIQAATLPDSLAGRDVLGRGRTGSGKTYAFLLPLVAQLSEGRPSRARRPRALVLAPTRELVGQIEQSLEPLAYATGLTSRTVYGGVSQKPQVDALRNGVDIILACPGRLEDLIKQGHCDLSDVQITVLDEADHMADLGFLPAVRRLLSQTPTSGQRLLFSATLDRGIGTLAKQFLNKPVTHEADSVEAPVTAMSHHVLHIDQGHKLPILVDLTSAPGRTVVFTRTKHRAKTLARQLNGSGVPTVELHGNLSQNARDRNLEALKSGKASVLVATDIAARGIHVDDITLVVHADPPAEHKAYLHRSGRTARAGNEGTVITLMTSEQKRDVRALAKAAGIEPKMTRIEGASHPVLTELAPGERTLPGGFKPAAPAQTGGSGRTGRSGGTASSGRPRRSGSQNRQRNNRSQGGQNRQDGQSSQGKQGGQRSAGSSTRGGAATGTTRSNSKANSNARNSSRNGARRTHSAGPNRAGR
uniref:ATP-dependent RNA helicase n=1 Tax=uncultured bacterium A1Q1_fos_2059 TaxID=1256559 RepID=L7VYI0_9BACT|nr:ATP-dependent RNA helicase [uncultured bacterium A1Q1_fos_2059]